MTNWILAVNNLFRNIKISAVDNIDKLDVEKLTIEIKFVKD